MAFAAIGMLKLPKAAVLASPSKRFKVNLPESLPPGEGFVPPGRSVAVFKDTEGVYAVSLICTHLGCIVKQTPSGFDCPCHGSRFAPDGSVTKGPAPAPLKWRKVSVAGNSVTVDEESSVPAGTKVQA
jgi:Rieske Fe-S protein